MRLTMVTAIAAAVISSQDAAPKPARFSGLLTPGPLIQRAAPIDIGVDRWASDESRAHFAAIYREGGQVALREAMKKEKVAGYVHLQSRQRLTASYVEEIPRPDGGRRILLLFVREPGEWELSADLGWNEYLFRVVALTLDGNGRGTGMIFHTAKVSFGETGVEMTGELSGQPTRITSIQKR